MELDDFITLDSSIQSNCILEDNDYEKSQAKESNSSASKAEVSYDDHIEAEDYTVGIKIEAHNENVEDLQHVQNMDFGNDDFMQKPFIPSENVHLVDSLTTLERIDKFETKLSTNVVSTKLISNATMNKLRTDESPIVSVKRARTASDDQQPSVRVVYNCLTRESKKMLMELMQQWSQWQAKHQPSSNVSGRVALESGEDTYFAALHVGSERANAVSFWLDNQSRKEDTGDSMKLDGDMVPLYDRGFVLGLTTPDGSNNTESELQASEASRCFNCGSYSHALKDCSKPRDNIAINNARKNHSSKRNQNAGSRTQNRYYQKTSGKFDDLKAGVLGSETRECLGIGELDPPPWLNRMRELGYPPGYLDDEDEDQPSGITIFADEEKGAESEEGELPEKLDPPPSKKRKTVEFPGINAPIPDKADNWLWATPSNSYSNTSHSNRPSDSHRGPYQDQVEFKDRRDNGPPGSVHGLAAFSRSGYSGRHNSSQDYNSIPRSPILGRSLSERSWQSPMPYENSPFYSPRSPHSPHPISNLPWNSPQYHSPSGDGHRSEEISYRSSSDGRERDPHRQDHYRHHHRR